MLKSASKVKKNIYFILFSFLLIFSFVGLISADNYEDGAYCQSSGNPVFGSYITPDFCNVNSSGGYCVIELKSFYTNFNNVTVSGTVNVYDANLNKFSYSLLDNISIISPVNYTGSQFPNYFSHYLSRGACVAGQAGCYASPFTGCWGSICPINESNWEYIFQIPPSSLMFIGQLNITFGCGSTGGFVTQPIFVSRGVDNWMNSNFNTSTTALGTVTYLTNTTYTGHHKVLMDYGTYYGVNFTKEFSYLNYTLDNFSFTTVAIEDHDGCLAWGGPDEYVSISAGTVGGVQANCGWSYDWSGNILSNITVSVGQQSSSFTMRAYGCKPDGVTSGHYLCVEKDVDFTVSPYLSGAGIGIGYDNTSQPINAGNGQALNSVSNALGNIFPDSHILSVKSKISYVMIVCALLAVLLIFIGFLIFKSVPVGWVYLTLFVEFLMFVFFITIGYIGIGVLVVLILVILALLFFTRGGK